MKFFSKQLLYCSLCLLLSSSVRAADYCGQPVPHDIAHEGYKEPVKNPFADPGAGSSSNQGMQGGQNTLSGQVIYIPPGSAIPLYLDRGISSSMTRLGDIAYAHIINGERYGIPAGSIAELVILMVEPAGRSFGRPGRIQIGANRILLPNGNSIWIKGLIVDQAGNPSLQNQKRFSRFTNTAGKVALGAGVGAASGVAIGAAANGNLGTGALVGTAIGAVIGGIWAATQKGQDVMLPSGMPVVLSVNQGTQAYVQ